MSDLRYPIQLRPSLRRHRWLPAWMWILLFLAFAFIAQSLVPPFGFSTASGSNTLGFSYIWVLTDGSFAAEPPNDQYGLMESSRVKDQYTVSIHTTFRRGGPHPTLGDWFVDPTDSYSAVITITDLKGSPVTPVEPYLPLILRRLEQILPKESQSDEMRDLLPNLKAGNTTWSYQNPSVRAHNRVVAARALCTFIAIPLFCMFVFTLFIPRRSELRREYLAASLCPECRYSIRDLGTNVCPECGASISV